MFLELTNSDVLSSTSTFTMTTHIQENRMMDAETAIILLPDSTKYLQSFTIVTAPTSYVTVTKSCCV